ncbi:MAG: hypothetical protein ACLU6W_10055 [Lachnospiraceae bacterium]
MEFNRASSHRLEHWFFMGHGKELTAMVKEPQRDFYRLTMPEPDHQDLFSTPTPTQEYLRTGCCVPVRSLTGTSRRFCILTGGFSMKLHTYLRKKLVA